MRTLNSINSIKTKIPILNQTYRKDRLTLTPRLDPLVRSLLSQKKLLFELAQAFGSPLNILFPQLIHQNVESFNKVFADHSIQGRVYFAHKATQSQSLIRQMAVEKSYLDVASANELKHALGSGFEGSRLGATGPKNTEFIMLALQHGVTLSIDSIPELQKVLKLRLALGMVKRTPIMLRLSGFKAEHTNFLNKDSRFGIPLNEISIALQLIEDSKMAIDLKGFAFHLNTVSIHERAIAIENCFELLENVINRGLEPMALNIGGGYKVNYLESEEEWNNYTTALRESILGTRESMTWNNHSFGLVVDKGKLRGYFNYNFYDQQTGPIFLGELLAHEIQNLGNRSAASLFRDNMIELWIEPGRSLLDQAGITVATVNNIRQSSRGELLVCLDMKRQDICFLDNEIFIDPVLIYHDQNKNESDQNIGVLFAGNLCLESDLIYRHKTYLAKMPEEGDLVAFVNSAGYYMDFSANRSLMQPIGHKVAITENAGNFSWTLDEKYLPVLIRN